MKVNALWKEWLFTFFAFFIQEGNKRNEFGKKNILLKKNSLQLMATTLKVLSLLKWSLLSPQLALLPTLNKLKLSQPTLSIISQLLKKRNLLKVSNLVIA